MQDLKISLITVAYNAQNTIGKCIELVLKQDFENIQYIIIDGGSTDKTIQVIDKYKEKIDYITSERENGVYDAMNKDIAVATGDVIVTLNADDYFSDNHVLGHVAEAFSQQRVNILYGNLYYTDLNGKTVRKWRSGEYKKGMFNWGWMPPHPTF